MVPTSLKLRSPAAHFDPLAVPGRSTSIRAGTSQGGLEVGRLVLEPGWAWQGEGPMPALPGQDDDQGWDRLGAAIEAWRERWKRGEEVPFRG